MSKLKYNRVNGPVMPHAGQYSSLNPWRAEVNGLSMVNAVDLVGRTFLAEEFILGTFTAYHRRQGEFKYYFLLAELPIGDKVSGTVVVLGWSETAALDLREMQEFKELPRLITLEEVVRDDIIEHRFVRS